MKAPTQNLSIFYIVGGSLLVILGIIPLGVIGGFVDAHNFLDSFNNTLASDVDYIKQQTSVSLLIVVAVPILLVGLFSIPTGIKRSKSLVLLEMVAVIIGLIWVGFMTISFCIHIFSSMDVAETGVVKHVGDQEPVITLPKQILKEFFSRIFSLQLVVTLACLGSWCIMVGLISSTCLTVFKSSPSSRRESNTEVETYLTSVTPSKQEK